MKIKKYLLILFTLVLTINMRAQTFDDLIITKEQDTIQCKITLINDYSIFYDYKKKKNTKSTYISKAEVEEYLSETYKVDENLKFSRNYPSCDTCKNWIVLKSDDTLFYNIKLNLLIKEGYHFSEFRVKEKESISYYTFDVIKSALWNNAYYYSFNLSNREIFDSENKNILQNVLQKEFVGYEKYSGRLKIVEFFYEILQFNDYSTHIELGYCILDKSEYVYIPNNRKEFIEVMRKYITENPKLLEAIENKEFKYKDLETIIKIYNLE
ncbi:hypothetical protein HNS38_06835 [Lentimicrobium sp. L6]|uniref:hypothetical protein n=1 Tax=Lentimicrobium sp. L6 TaxID=2735916 RepID=UPI001555C109|nr:hypothetical protein [Lentimicrobium sp. L6]NPD84465.1 hypothetical protein [Lentimicrobium sp. L6]